MRAHIKRMELADIFAVGFILHHTLPVFKRFNVFSVPYVPFRPVPRFPSRAHTSPVPLRSRSGSLPRKCRVTPRRGIFPVFPLNGFNEFQGRKCVFLTSRFTAACADISRVYDLNMPDGENCIFLLSCRRDARPEAWFEIDFGAPRWYNLSKENSRRRARKCSSKLSLHLKNASRTNTRSQNTV